MEKRQKTIPLPTVADCFLYFDQFAMLDNIRAHSIMVARVAQTIYDCILPHVSKENLPIKQEVVTGALLHDIAKSLCLGTDKRHGIEGGKICRELGYPQLAESVEEHVHLHNFMEEEYRIGKFSAKEFVFYADKRVNHDQIVTLDIREEYILKRYGQGIPERLVRIKKSFQTTHRLEACFFLHLPFTPDQLIEHLVPYVDDFGLSPKE